MSAQSNAPIIIKRKKVVGGDGHHGGAWKVAYADFVTAMMAFFMLMWLLNATTEKQRKGIADYFSPTIPINRISGGGDGSFNGDSVFTEDTLAKVGRGASSQKPSAEDQARGDSGTQQENASNQADADLVASEERLLGKAGESAISDQLLKHIVTKVTEEGLIVEIFPLPDAPLFQPDTDTPTAVLTALVSVVAEVFALAQNDVAINAYVASQPITVRENTVWEKSAARAQAVRHMLKGTPLPPDRIRKITGFADRKPIAENAMANRNNRIEMILLRR